MGSKPNAGILDRASKRRAGEAHRQQHEVGLQFKLAAGDRLDNALAVRAFDQLGIAKDQRGNAKAPTYETSEPGVFAAGDARRGQSLIVWAINEGRQCARMVERYLGTLEPRELVPTGNVAPADEGPEGPPDRARFGIDTGDR